MECFILPSSEAPRRPRMASDASKLFLRCSKDDLLAPKTPAKRPPGPQNAPQDSPKMSPRSFQDGPRFPREGSNCAQLLQRPSRSPPDLDFGPSRPRFWTLQTSIFHPRDLDVAPSIMRYYIQLWYIIYLYSCCIIL